MIKKTYGMMFTKQTNQDYLRELWSGTIHKLRKKFTIITIDDMLISDTHPDNVLAELELKMGKSEHSFQYILANSL
ncbi:MAG: hypothetical protein V4651_06400 [Bacteroidota bacterium]